MSAGLISLMSYSTPSSSTSGLALLSVLTPRMRIVPSVGAGFGVVLVDPHARGVVHRLRGGDGLVGLFSHIDRGDRAGEIHALDRAVAYDHDVLGAVASSRRTSSAFDAGSTLVLNPI